MCQSATNVTFPPATCVAYQPAKCVAYQIAILVCVTYQPESTPLESRGDLIIPGEETCYFYSMRTDIIEDFLDFSFKLQNQDRFEQTKNTCTCIIKAVVKILIVKKAYLQLMMNEFSVSVLHTSPVRHNQRLK
jgi:hypothetical protein